VIFQSSQTITSTYFRFLIFQKLEKSGMLQTHSPGGELLPPHGGEQGGGVGEDFW
jgi:hypothetical protein